MNLVSFIYFLVCIGTGLLIARLLPVPKWLKLLAGPAIGIVSITEVILVTSLVLGYSSVTILTSLIVTLLVTIVLNNIHKTEEVKDQFSLKSHWPVLLILTSVGLFSLHIFTTQVLAPQEGGLVTGGGGLYGDTALHSAYTMSIVEQGIPPKNPLFAPQPLIYPFLVNLYSASLVTLGSNLRFAFILPQLVYFLAFVSLFYYVAKQLTSNKSAFIAMLLFFLGWGFGFITFINESLLSGVWQPTHEYTNNMKDYHLHNSLTGLIFPERSFLPGLVIGLLITALFFQHQKNKRNYLLPIIGILIGILPLWHTHTFLFFGASVGIWLLTTFLSGRSLRFSLVIKPILLIYLPALLLALPVIWWFSGQVTHGSFIHLSLGWIKGQNQFLFWLKNAGLVIPLALTGFFLHKKYWGFFLAPLVLFVIANLVIFQPWDWDNIKLFTWVFLFLSVLAAYTIVRLSEKGVLGKGIAVILVTISLFSGTLSLIGQAKQTYTIYDREDQLLASWVRENTLPSDVFLVDPWPNHPVPGLAGRSVYLGYPGHLWVHGINYNTREQSAKLVLSGHIEALSQAEVPIDYIVQDASKPLELPEVYQSDKFRVYRTR